MSGNYVQSLLRPSASNIIFDSEKDRNLNYAGRDSISSVEDEKHDADEYSKLQTPGHELSTSREEQPAAATWLLICRRILIHHSSVEAIKLYTTG
ncbi:hypothetical protein QC763_0092760 [Podospora pseudopauciseta]|uniref:Uncharacterized protein n=2 Tax=Podospora TaxID=5144 RepID=A0ABR0H4A0_9PEZI|nr:hypothetical protein QC763_0092760 [Podospora pseudopauciseta]KAK4671194.1 hypothetical protein QC764_0092770 [Podospora pseudoanserina]